MCKTNNKTNYFIPAWTHQMKQNVDYELDTEMVILTQLFHSFGKLIVINILFAKR